MKVGVFTAGGVGNGLIMMVVANALRKEGFTVFVYNNHLTALKELFEEFSLEPIPEVEKAPSFIKTLDLIFLQHDNSPLAKALLSFRKQHRRVVSFYTMHQTQKHGPLQEDDYVLPKKKPIVHGIQEAMVQFLGKDIGKDIGMRPWKTRKKIPKKVVLHPFTGTTEKNWPQEKFIVLAKKLRARGFLPYLCMSPEEKSEFPVIDDVGIEVTTLHSLSDLITLFSDASFFIGNSSGTGHLASYMEIPSIILSGQEEIVHWQPGWLPATIISPPAWIPNRGRLFRLKERYWKKWISVNKVFSIFLSLAEE